MMQPPLNSPIGSNEWIAWFDQVTIAINSIQKSGTTADRPTKNLYIGQRYFDTTLGRPIYLQSYAFGVATWAFSNGLPA